MALVDADDKDELVVLLPVLVLVPVRDLFFVIVLVPWLFVEVKGRRS